MIKKNIFNLNYYNIYLKFIIKIDKNMKKYIQFIPNMFINKYTFLNELI